MLLGSETLEDRSQLPKKAKNAAFGRLQAFCMYGGIGMSASSLHRKESTDSLMIYTTTVSYKATSKNISY